jgi:hypothetical protein
MTMNPAPNNKGQSKPIVVKNNSVQKPKPKTTVLDVRPEMTRIALKLNQINPNKNPQKYDVEGFVNDLKYWVNDLHYFYARIVKNQDPKHVYYKITPSQRPKEGQIAYVNLRRGYPKELYDGHYCYILKDFGYKFLVIPTTSVKPNSSPLNPNFELDIEIKDFINTNETRLQISDIRSIDIQRINTGKGVYDVITDKEYIAKGIKNILFN